MSVLQSSIAAFLATEPHGVISTVHENGSVESALVAFSETPELHITIGTDQGTRKFANILREPRVAFVVTDNELLEVQLEGRARVTSGDEHETCKERHLAKNPKTAKYANDPGQRFIVIEPTWIRFTDRRTEPTTVEELRF
jgi:general stress protein 26